MKEIEGIAQSDPLVEKINSLIEVMRQHEGLLNWEFTQPESLLQFLKSTSALRQLSQHAEGFTGSDDLERVTRAATSVFTHPGKQSVDKTFNTIKSLKEVDNAIYLQTLAEWIAEEKIKTDELDLSNEEWLELAPHLTFLEYVEREELDPDAFVGDLLEKTEKLAELRIVSSQMTGKALEKFINTDHLVLLTITSSALMKKHLIQFLLPIYRIDKERAITLAKSLGFDEEHLVFYELFLSRFPDRLDDILSWVENSIDQREPCIRIFSRKLIDIDLLKDDPHQQFLILTLIEFLDNATFDAFLEFFTPLIKSPMDEALLKFYEKMLGKERYGRVPHVQVTLLLADVTREKQLGYLPYLTHEKMTHLGIVFLNLQNLGKTELFDYFIQQFSDDLVKQAFRTENLFTEDRNDNRMTIHQIKVYVEEFYTYLVTHHEDDFPDVLKNVEDLFQTLPGQVFLKTCLHDIVKIPRLQGAALRALPPSNRENIELYPKKVVFDSGTLTLTLRVVPTLPVVDSRSILNALTHHYVYEGMNQLHINYYGTPAIDASGPGRQFFAEVIQGEVVNKESLFIPAVGGGMAPYDRKHIVQSKRVICIFYRNLGSFFSLALHFQYPIGKVLSEKVISCLCTFPTEALNNRDFNVPAFVSDMSSAALIQFMKDSTIEDEALVKLYEKVLLASNDVEILQAAQQLNVLIEDDKLQDLIDGGVNNILRFLRIQECVREVFIEGASYYLYAVYALAQGMNKRLPSSIGEHEIHGWEDVRSLGAVELSRHLQGELTAQHIKGYLRIKIIGEATPEKVLAAENVKVWTEKWIDAKAENPEILANFVQAFSGGRALTREIRFDIDPHVHNVKVHTCFNSADIPTNITETWLLAIFDEFGAGDLRFDME